MSTGIVVAGGAALAYYVYLKRKNFEVDGFIETHRNVEHAPTNWTGELYLFAEALRYMYFETVARWPTADLFIGLVYLARQGLKDFPAAEVVANGTRLNPRTLATPKSKELREELFVLHRLLLYSQNLKFTRPSFPEDVWRDMELSEDDFLVYEPKAAVLKPSHVLVKDEKLHCIVLAIRGTHSVRDIFTSLSGASKPHHLVNTNGVVLGYSHFGMLAAARWLLKERAKHIKQALDAFPGYQLRVTGHSMGGGTAALLTMMIREQYPEFGDVQCSTFACPGCMTEEIAKSCESYVTSIVYGTDVVPSFSPATVDLLREEVGQSSWGQAFRRDVRSSSMVQAVEGRVKEFSRSVSTWTRQATARLPGLKMCVGPREKHKSQDFSADDNEIMHVIEEELRALDLAQGSGDACPNVELPVSSSGNLDQDDDGFGGGSEPQAGTSTGPILRRPASFKDRVNSLTAQMSKAAEPGASAIAQWGKKTGTSVVEGAGSLWGRVFRKRSQSEQGIEEIEVIDEAGNGINSPEVQDAMRAEEVEGVFDGRTGSEDAEIGETDSGSTSRLDDGLWRRTLLPAGRIMHIVPAYILESGGFGHDSDFVNENSVDCVGEGERSNEGEGGWYYPTGSDAPFTMEEEFVMFADMPQSAYGRIRMCRSMVMDHFVPRYRSAIESLMAFLDFEGNSD